jgi:guanylate kinase
MVAEGNHELGDLAGSLSAIVVTGPVGAGKSTTMAAISEELERLHIPHAVVDMDYLRWLYPRPEGDRFAVELGYRNLAAIWPNFRERDVACVVLADVVETRDQVRAYEEAMPGTSVTVVRLDVPMPELERRLQGRESEATIAWYLDRAPELRGIMEREGIGDIVIDVGTRQPTDVAREIIERTGIGL